MRSTFNRPNKGIFVEGIGAVLTPLFVLFHLRLGWSHRPLKTCNYSAKLCLLCLYFLCVGGGGGGAGNDPVAVRIFSSVL